MDTPYGRIYLLRNLTNGRVYVGQTKGSLSSRWKRHQSTAKTSQAPLHRALRKSGPDFFQVEELELCADSVALNLAEAKWVAYYCSNVRGVGYNCTSGGDAGHVFTVEARERISSSQKKRLQDPQVKARMAMSARRQWSDPDFRTQASRRAKLQFGNPEARQASSRRQKQMMAECPERRGQLAAYNQTIEARVAKSLSRKKFFQENPEKRKAFSVVQRTRLAQQGESKADFILKALEGGERLSRDLVSERYPIDRVNEGLSRYQKVGFVKSRPLLPEERPDICGRCRSRAKVWSLCA